MADIFDVIVIGAGPAGENVVDRAARGGLSVAVVEKELAGGECSYWACIPSKTLLRPVELAAEVSRVPGLEVAPIDTAAVLARRDTMVARYDDGGQARWLASVPATLIRGHGRLTGARQVEVVEPSGDAVQLTARHAVVLATGSTPVIPPIDGLAEAKPWTNREATGVTDMPERLAIIGGGVVACEMAQALHRLGATDTTMIVRGDGLLERMEPFAGSLVRASLEEQGVRLLTRRNVVRVARPVAGGEVTLHLDDGSRLVADELLVATGRRAATADLGLSSIGLPDSGPIEVDDSMRVPGVEGGWLYAVGDVNGRNLLTHMGKYQGRVCGDVIAARAHGRTDTLPGMRDRADAFGAPQVVFTEPQVCAVGRTEAQARADGFPVRAVEYDIGNVAGAYLFADDYRGHAKAVVDTDREVLLGVTFVGPGVAELLHAATIAVTTETPLHDLWHAVPAFPTISEVWLRLLETYGL